MSGETVAKQIPVPLRRAPKGFAYKCRVCGEPVELGERFEGVEAHFRDNHLDQPMAVVLYPVCAVDGSEMKQGWRENLWQCPTCGSRRNVNKWPEQT